jgi:aspartyl protease family protein
VRPLLAISLVILLASAAAPSLFTRYMERAATAEANVASDVSTEPDATLAAPGTVQIRAERDGHFYVDAHINLRPVRMMVDTGATVVALRESDAAAAGIRVRTADFQYPVQTANGVTRAAEAMIDGVSIIDIEVERVRALVLPDDQLAISLLGGSFLGRLARYEVRDGTLIFEN